MAFQFTIASRKAVPQLVSVAGTSGSGKTYSALLLAAGMAGPGGKVGLVDTENGRGEMYTDSPGIAAALPNRFLYCRMDPPFSPAKHIEILKAAEAAGVDVLVQDSASHEWEGLGGCCDIAENNKLKGMPNWSLAKREHKRLMNYLLTTRMHIIFCLRAREKVKIIEDPKKEGNKLIVPMGIQPIAEKNFVFEMLLSLQLDESTHRAVPVKVPEPLMGLFSAGHLITKEDGEAIRLWNEGGAQLDPFEQVKKRARAAAVDGVKAYAGFFATLTTAQKKALVDTIHEELKADAERADAEAQLKEQQCGSDSAACAEPADKDW